MSRRLYLGRLPQQAQSEDIKKFFDGYGRIVDCRVMTGFAFVEFEHAKDAEEVLQQFNGKEFMSSPVILEYAKETRSRRDPMDDRAGSAIRARRPPGYRVIVRGISRDTSWQDLKDFGREAGSVSFSDIDRDVPGQGILEYLSRDDAYHAVRHLDGRDLRGHPVRVSMDDMRGPDNYRRDDRHDERMRDYRDYPPRRDRSRSPYRRRTPPPARYDDRRPPPYDERRGGNDYYDRHGDIRRDDRRDDRRGYDRPSRGAENGWSGRGSRDYD